MIVLDNLQTGLGYALPVPSGKTALLLYADELGTSAPTLRIAFEYPWTMVKPTVVTWETSPIKVAVPKGATKVTLSLTSKTPAAAVTVDWA